MRKFYLFVLIPLLMTLFNIGSSYAAPPLNDRTQHTPLSLMPETLVPSLGVKVAATWWLPDWQNNQTGRHNDDDGGGDIIKDDDDCMKHYNLYKTCPTPKVSTGVTHPVTGLTCQKSCICPNEYQYTSSNCSGNKMLSGASCDGKHNACVCKPEFKYTSSNCSGEYKLSGTPCDGKYNGCVIRPECAVTSQSCTYGCAQYNSCSKCIACKSNPDCSVTPKSCTYGCASTNSCGICVSCSGNPDCDVSSRSCTYGCASYNSCSKCISCRSCTDTCPSYTVSSSSSCSYGYESCYDTCGGRTWYKCNSRPAEPVDPCAGKSCGTNAYCSGGTCYCNSGYEGNANYGCTKINTCTDTCSSKGYSSSQPSGKTCSTTTVCGSTCYYNCSTNHSHSYSCPSGYSASNSWGSSAQTASKTCSCGATSGTCYKAPAHTHSYSCPSGYSASNSWGSCAATTSKTCSCGASSGTCYKNKCSSGQTCDNGTCKTPCTPSCTNETGCSWGSHTVSNGCGGTCTKCYPACTAGYKYNFSSYDCDVRPAKYLYQPGNPNCGKCVCDNKNSNCGGRPCACSYI